MTIKTVEEYIESLKDGRDVWFEGEKVEDVTSHRIVRTCVEVGAMDYALAQDPRFQDLLIEKDESGETYHFVFKPMESVEDLVRKRRIVHLTARSCFGMPGGTKFTGIDGLNSITSLSRRMDREIGTDYSPRVEALREEMKKNDSAVAVAVTDVKGDRSLRPSQQEDKDLYVRIVDERPDGIVVRGAKMHISWAPVVNELIVIPTRAMKEDDREYAVAFSVKPDTPGLKFILGEPETGDEENDFDHPYAAHVYTGEAVVIFDDVFIPMDRVFLKGEWQYAGHFAYMFANYHRLSADAYKYTENEILTGAAALMAEYNGVQNASHIQEKLAWLAWYTETTEALGMAACHDCVRDPESGLVYPNPVYSNAAKFFFAENYHQALKHVIDIAGGIVATAPSGKDLLSPHTGPLLEKYLAGRAGVSGGNRLRVVKLIKDLVSHWMQTTTLHAEGSLAAQKMSILSISDWDRYKAAAMRVVGIDDGGKHPVIGELPDFPTWTWRTK